MGTAVIQESLLCQHPALLTLLGARIANQHQHRRPARTHSKGLPLGVYSGPRNEGCPSPSIYNQSTFRSEPGGYRGLGATSIAVEFYDVTERKTIQVDDSKITKKPRPKTARPRSDARCEAFHTCSECALSGSID